METTAAATPPAKTPPARPPGAPGIGRMQVFQANAEQVHYPAACAECGRPLDPAGAVACAGTIRRDRG